MAVQPTSRANIKDTLTVAGLLHDIGKIVQRAEGRKIRHSEIGAEFIQSEAYQIREKALILECIRNHHYEELTQARLAKNHLAYIIYEADNIAAGLDRRHKDDPEMDWQGGIYRPLDSVFDLLGEARGENHFLRLTLLDDRDVVNIPQLKKTNASQSEYQAVVTRFSQELARFQPDNDRAESILNLMEAVASYVPASTLPREYADISLFDHSKITAALAVCLYEYFREHEIDDYQKFCLGAEQTRMRNKPAFCLVSADLSGIQNFIYTISSRGALKSLRGRSFYLDLIMENIADEILQQLGLSRANLLYNGGGHFYLLLPATEEAKGVLEATETFNTWMLRHYSTSLYLALDWEYCSANELMATARNGQTGGRTTGTIFQILSEKLSNRKLRRYSKPVLEKMMDSGSEINRLSDFGRECEVCRTSTSPIADKRIFEDSAQICETCYSLLRLGGRLPELEERDTTKVFLMTPAGQKRKEGNPRLPTLDGGELYADYLELPQAEAAARKGPAKNSRIYAINKFITGGPALTHLWAGTYAARDAQGGMIEFAELAERSLGIKRLAVLRADVDNLGTFFSQGFGEGADGRSRSTLSRYASLSRQLSLFFKHHINNLCLGNDTGFRLGGDFGPGLGSRDLVITYSGGDDVFIVGAWDQIIEFAVDLRTQFQRFSCGRLSLSAGIGLFRSGHPIYRMAEITAELEQRAKAVPGKDSLALFGMSFDPVQDHCYKWDVFIQKVCQEKLNALMRWQDRSSKEISAFAEPDDAGLISRAFLYRLIRLAEKRLASEDRMPLARLAYMLGRVEPKPEQLELGNRYQEMRERLYHWLNDREESRQLLTALLLVLYLSRREEDE